MLSLNFTFFYLVLPYWFVEIIIRAATGDSIFEQEDNVDFWLDDWLPELDNALKDVSISILEQIDLWRAFLGYLIKTSYAFLYQEDIIDLDFMYTQSGLELL